MRANNPIIEAAKTGVTTFCTCWRVTRRDGQVFGFTDHNEDILFDGVTHIAATGMSSPDWLRSTGLNVDTAEVTGALSSEAITDQDILKGLWDDAAIRIWRVDWADNTSRLLIFTGSIGQVERGQLGFRAEIRGQSHYLNQEVGLNYTRKCNATLGDDRCGVDINAYKETGAVFSVAENRLVTVSGLDSFEPGWFSRGKIEWTSGQNIGAQSRVHSHWIDTVADAIRIELDEPLPEPVMAGDTFYIWPGCDRSIPHCKRYGNIVNYRGFAFMPTDEVAFSYVISEQRHDGGSFFR